MTLKYPATNGFENEERIKFDAVKLQEFRKGGRSVEESERNSFGTRDGAKIIFR